MKPTLVIGANADPTRYAFKAITLLRSFGHTVAGFGIRPGKVADVDIETNWNPDWEIDTVTMYVNPGRQSDLIQPIIDLKPKRVVFNPGTENPEFMNELRRNGIKAEEACTLVLLHTGQY